MQKLANFIIQTSRVDVAGYGEQIHIFLISKKSKDSYFRPFCQNRELKNRLWGAGEAGGTGGSGGRGVEG
jgi:hypothetical protein